MRKLHHVVWLVVPALSALGADLHVVRVGDREPEIHTAIRKRDLAEVKRLLAKDPRNANVTDYRGGQYSSILVNAFHGNKAIAEALLAAGADIKARSHRGETVLFGAETADIAEFYVQKGAEVGAKDKDGQTALHVARNAEVASVLVRHGADVGLKDRFGYTPLHTASEYGRTDVVQFLIGRGVKADSPSTNGSTPLHLAVAMGRSEACELLIANGADVNARAKSGLTPLDVAWHSSSTNPDFPTAKITDMLRKHGARSTPRFDFLLAVRQGELAKVRDFLDHHPGLADARDPYTGATALHWASVLPSTDMLKTLAAGKAKLDAVNEYGQTPLHWAARRGLADSVKFLVSLGANARLRDHRGLTPEDVAREAGHRSLADSLRATNGEKGAGK